MRLLYITASPIPSTLANSVHVMCMGQAFAGSGLATTLIARRSNELTGVRDDFACYGVKPSFEIAKLRCIRGLNFLYSRAAARLALSHKPDAVYGRDLLGVYLAGKRGMPVIFESHSPLAGPLRRVVLQRLVRLKNLKRIVVISEALKSIMLEAHPGVLREDMLMVAHDGVDLERFASLPDKNNAREELGLPTGAFVAGYFGHLYRGRGAELILDVARALPDVTFLLVGGRPGDIARVSTAASGLANVRFLGHVPRGKLLPYWAACDVLLMPYQRTVTVKDGGNTAAWMSPMKMFEYMAAGRPIISSDLPVLREVLKNDSNAHLMPPDSVIEWAQAILRIRERPADGARIAAQARRDVEKYSWRSRASQVMQDI